ncbi:MAG: HEAT repeat domain-containing protein [Archangium sp.]
MVRADATSNEEPSVVGVRVRPIWSIVLYALLVASAGVALYVQRAPNVDPTLTRLAPWLFLVFGLGFSIYRVALVAARRYSPFKAFIQIFLAALFFLLLLLPGVQVGAAAAKSDSLLGHQDARVRAMAAELSGWRNDQTSGKALVGALGDSDAAVRQAAHDALVKLNGGADLGSAEDANARAAWGARFP